jgi:RNA polymerase sigma-70 factor (ECF subfamily)
MSPPESTCWTVIRGAAAGDAAQGEEFARRYAPIVRAYLAARWRGSSYQRELDDAVQEVFVECFRQSGALAQVDASRAGGFRPFLYGIVRNVALRLETRQARAHRTQSPHELEQVQAREESLSRVFDRAWARALLREAAQRQAAQAQQAGTAALRRVELLRLRFHDGLPIREIAHRWGADAAVVHRDYAKARQEFKAALVEVVAFHHPGSRSEIEQECANLLALLE